MTLKTFIAPSYHKQRSPQQHVIILSGLVGLIVAAGAAYGYLISIMPLSSFLMLAIPIIILIMLIFWALPEIGKAPEKAIETLFFGYMVGLFLWPNYFAIAIPGLPWISMSRLWGGPLVFFLLLSCSISAPFRRAILEPFQSNRWMLRAMLGFVCTQCISLFFSKHFGDSANRLVNYQIAWTAMFFASAFVLSKPGRLLRLAALLCAMAAVQTLVAFFEYRAGGVLWAQHAPPFVALNDPTVRAILAGGARAATGTYRVQSIYTTSLNFAEFLGITTPLFLHFMMTARRALWRILSGLYLPYAFWVILTTDSRIGLVGFFLSCLLYFLLWALKRKNDRPRDMVAPLLLIAYPLMFTGFVGLSLFWMRLNHMIFGGGAQAASNESRQIQIQTGIPKVLHWPIGYGPGMAATTLGFADNEDGKLTIDNYWLSIALEYGILGFICFMTLMLYGIGQSFRYGLKAQSPESKLLLPFGALVFVFLTGKSVLSQEDSHALIFVVLGGIAALSHREATQRTQKWLQ